jgi:hypothetical protein
MMYSAQPKVVAKAGSVSLREARAAARAAKTGHYLRAVSGEIKEVGGLWERYLGHFGSTAKKVSGTHAKAKSVKKVAAKKGAVRKKPKSSAKKVVAKKRSAKKASAKKR